MKRLKAFIWGSFFFCTMDGFFKILEKALFQLICTRLYNIYVFFTQSLRTYSRVHISSDSLFSKILKKPSIVQKKMIPHMNGLLIFFETKQILRIGGAGKWGFFWGGHFEFSKSAILNFFLLHLCEKSSPFIWGIIFFCTMDGFIRILEKRLSELICTRLYPLVTQVSKSAIANHKSKICSYNPVV